jgi:uncharacterized repeat protein (TIGR02543 family)
VSDVNSVGSAIETSVSAGAVVLAPTALAISMGSGVVRASWIAGQPDTGVFALQWSTEAHFNSYEAERVEGTRVDLNAGRFVPATTYYFRVFAMPRAWTVREGHSRQNVSSASDIATGVAAAWLAQPSPAQTISYAAGGGSGTGPTSPVHVAYGSSFVTPANTFTRAGYTFAGWSDGTSTFAAGSTFPTVGGVTTAVTLTATWTANTLTATFDSQGGSAIPDGSTTTGGTLNSPLTDPTQTCYTFLGWSATVGGATITFPYAHGRTANFTLYAKWEYICQA